MGELLKHELGPWKTTRVRKGNVIAIGIFDGSVLIFRGGRPLRRSDCASPLFKISDKASSLNEYEIARLVAYSIGRDFVIQDGMTYEGYEFWNTYRIT